VRNQAVVTAESELRLCASGYVLLRENIMHTPAMLADLADGDRGHRREQSARIRRRAHHGRIAAMTSRCKGGMEIERTASRLRLPQHAGGGLSRLDIPSSLTASPYTSLYSYGVNLPHPLLCLLTKLAERKGEVN